MKEAPIDFGMSLYAVPDPPQPPPSTSVVPASGPADENGWQIYYFDGHPIRCKLIEGEPWFLVGDACKAVGLDNVTMALTRVDGDDINETEVISPYGSSGATRRQTVKIVTEYGLYDLILGSDKPEAKRFKRWITHEVIPAIRKTGSYIVQPPVQLDEPGSMLAELKRQATMGEQQNRMLWKAIESAEQAHAETALVRRQVNVLEVRVEQQQEELGRLESALSPKGWQTIESLAKRVSFWKLNYRRNQILGPQMLLDALRMDLAAEQIIMNYPARHHKRHEPYANWVREGLAKFMPNAWDPEQGDDWRLPRNASTRDKYVVPWVSNAGALKLIKILHDKAGFMTVEADQERTPELYYGEFPDRRP